MRRLISRLFRFIIIPIDGDLLPIFGFVVVVIIVFALIGHLMDDSKDVKTRTRTDDKYERRYDGNPYPRTPKSEYKPPKAHEDPYGRKRRQ